MSEQQQRSNTPRKIITAFALFMFLVGLPLGSYIYLKKGYDYQKAALQDLRKEHRLSLPSSLDLFQGTSEFVPTDCYHLIGLIPAETNPEGYTPVLKRLHEQFDLPDNLMIWTVFEGDNSDRLSQYLRKAELPQDTSQLLFWNAPAPQFDAFVNDLQLLADEQSQLSEGLIVLVDDSLYIRRAYPYMEPEAVKQLVERTAILLPERSKPKPELRRKAEL